MKKGLIYIHGKNGTSAEAEHYRPFFAGYEIIGLQYQAQTPWDAQDEFSRFFAKIADQYAQIIIIANSIGAFFTMHALKNMKIKEAYFISPIVNMEELIKNMMLRANVTETELQHREIIQTEFGESLSWQYLQWVRKHPIIWNIKTHILYGDNDNLQSLKSIQDFAEKTKSDVMVIKNGEHWFHTKEQMRFLDNWLNEINLNKNQ